MSVAARSRRDYYAVLGVPHGADRTTIRRAFLTLAAEWHPDVSVDPEAVERFREIAEAYEVLSRPDTRERYDRYGFDPRDQYYYGDGYLYRVDPATMLISQVVSAILR